MERGQHPTVYGMVYGKAALEFKSFERSMFLVMTPLGGGDIPNRQICLVWWVFNSGRPSTS
jgi:hypothetical protein